MSDRDDTRALTVFALLGVCIGLLLSVALPYLDRHEVSRERALVTRGVR